MRDVTSWCGKNSDVHSAGIKTKEGRQGILVSKVLNEYSKSFQRPFNKLLMNPQGRQNAFKGSQRAAGVFQIVA